MRLVAAFVLTLLLGMAMLSLTPGGAHQ